VNTIRDTVYLDSVNYVVNVSTLRDSVGTAVQTQGRWDLINSEENLQLKDDSSRAVRIFRITEKTKSKMKLRLGEEEYQFEKK
jgi:CRISPR/Cas system-associated protein endoribonuclease Cas2